MLPVVTIIGLQAGLLLSGAILTETVFAFPGMGSASSDAIFNHNDYDDPAGLRCSSSRSSTC